MEYLKPLDFYKEIFKDNSKKKYHSKPGRFLCFDVSDKYVSLAVSDWKNKTAAPLRALDRLENNSTSDASDLFQSLGFIVGTRNTNSIILNFVLENLKLSPPQNIMEMAYAVCALCLCTTDLYIDIGDLTYLDDMNKMVDGSNKKSTMPGTSTMPFAATRPSSSEDTVPELLGLHVSENYVSLSVSDWKNKTAVPLRALVRQENNLTCNDADLFQSLIYEHNIVGFVVGTSKASPIDTPTQSFIDNLCKNGKFKELKYTLWDYSITSKHAEFVFNRHLEFILENLNQPKNLNQTIMERCYAVPTLQGYLDMTNKMVEEDWNI